jgi:protein involved in polysaccharide export with SLBB domain
MNSSLRPIRSLVRHVGSWRVRAALCACATLLATSGALAAQQSGAGKPPTTTSESAGATQRDREVKPDTPDATREELTLLLEQTLRHASDASLKRADRNRAQEQVTSIRRRLEEGDFQPGDRFVLTVVADSVRRSQMIVRDGPSIDFGALPSLQLGGILRSELQTAIHRHLSRYFRTPDVRVQLLTRITISGAVPKPGSYSVPPDALVSDVVMEAGGLLQSARGDKIVVTRAGREIVDAKGYQRAVRDGATIERLGLQSGDEIRVGQRGQRNWGQFATIAVVTVSALTAVLALIRSSYAE